MDILWLKDFQALAAQKNFSRAAEERRVSQPAFSRRIRALEDEIGVQLINRQTLPLSLTPAGDVFLAQARTILQTYSDTIERCKTIDAAGKNVIRFATSQSLYMTHYKTHIAPLVEKGGLDIDLNSTSWAADQFVTALQQRYCDVILTYWHPSMDFLSPLEASNCDFITLSTDMFIPVAKTKDGIKPEHYLPHKGRKPVPLLSYGSASALKCVLDCILTQHLNHSSLLVVNQNALAISVKAMIMEGFGMGWLPLEICKTELDNGSFAIAGDASFRTELEVRIYRERENTKPTLNKLWRELKRHA